jgi:hypothetical protein
MIEIIKKYYCGKRLIDIVDEEEGITFLFEDGYKIKQSIGTSAMSGQGLLDINFFDNEEQLIIQEQRSSY